MMMMTITAAKKPYLPYLSCSLTPSPSSAHTYTPNPTIATPLTIVFLHHKLKVATYTTKERVDGNDPKCTLPHL